MVNALPLVATVPFESIEGEGDDVYRSSLKMIAKVKVCAFLRFIVHREG